MKGFLIHRAFGQQGLSVLPGSDDLVEGSRDLVERIRSGQLHLSDIPAFIGYFIEIAIIAAGIVAFLMILVGGYQYIVGGVYSDMREQGKNTLTYALAGLILSLLSYAIVNLIQLAVTAL